MGDLDTILEKAKDYLCTGWTSGKGNARLSTHISPKLIYDHSVRVLELTRILGRQIRGEEHPLDATVITAGALFHDAGWVDLVRTGQMHPAEIYSRPADAELFQRSARVVCEQIATTVPSRTLERIVEVIGELKSPRPAQPETRALSDADNLEDFGLLGLTFQFRIAHGAGKSTTQIIESWQRQQEYHYWEARIKTALHLESARAIARSRLESMGRVFDLLNREARLDDVKEIFTQVPTRDFVQR